MADNLAPPTDTKRGNVESIDSFSRISVVASAMGNNTYFEDVEALPQLKRMKTQESLYSNGTHIHHEPFNVTNDDKALLRRLRTLEGAEYEAQYIDNKPIPKGELVKKLANPTPLGIASFCVINTVTGLFLIGARGVTHLNALVGMFWFTGGLTFWIVGIFEMLIGNTFGWALFGTLGGYFFTQGVLLTPAFGIAAAYAEFPAEMENALGLLNCAWASLFFMFLIAAAKTNIPLVWIFVFVEATTIVSALANFQTAMGNTEVAGRLQIAAGTFLLTAVAAGWYLFFIMITESTGLNFKLPIGSLEGKHKEERRS